MKYIIFLFIYLFYSADPHHQRDLCCILHFDDYSIENIHSILTLDFELYLRITWTL